MGGLCLLLPSAMDFWYSRRAACPSTPSPADPTSSNALSLDWTTMRVGLKMAISLSDRPSQSLDTHCSVWINDVASVDQDWHLTTHAETLLALMRSAAK